MLDLAIEQTVASREPLSDFSRFPPEEMLEEIHGKLGSRGIQK
jgi:hypothetical protein